MPAKPSHARKLVAAPCAGLLAAFMTLFAVLGAACSPDPPDSRPQDGSADSAQEAQPSDNDGSGSTASDGEAGDDTPQADDESESDQAAASDGDATSSDAPEPGDGAADLGTYRDYAPATADATPLPVDPQVVTGRLDNGFTYYLRSNDSPGGTAVARLVVGVDGSADPVGAEGTAHFLEHMLLRGTARSSRNELGEALRSLGTSVDPHTYSSAYTTRPCTPSKRTSTTLRRWASRLPCWPSGRRRPRSLPRM